MIVKYPFFAEDCIRIRKGIDGSEPEYFIEYLSECEGDYEYYSIVINTHYMSFTTGKFINKRILEAIERVLKQLGLANTIFSSDEWCVEENIIPQFDLQWLSGDELCVLLNEKEEEIGRLCYWNMSYYYGDYYGEDQACLLCLPNNIVELFEKNLVEECIRSKIQYKFFSKVSREQHKASLMSKLFRKIR